MYIMNHSKFIYHHRKDEVASRSFIECLASAAGCLQDINNRTI